MLGSGAPWIFLAFFRGNLFLQLLLICVLLSLRAPDGQQFNVAGRKHKRLHKLEPIDIEPVAHDSPVVLLAEVAEIVGVNQLPIESVGSDEPALQPSLVDPFLHFARPYVQCFGQCVFRKPILSYASARPQPVQHGSYRSRRAPQQSCYFLERMGRDQVQEFLLFSFGPRAIGTLCLDASLASESPARASRIAGNSSDFGDQGLQPGVCRRPRFLRLRRVQMGFDKFSRCPGPTKRVATDFSIRFFHAHARRGGRDPTSPPTYTWQRNRDLS